ncbi:MAG: PEGA domain-containing protein [Planctomycetes bacterium]|nr:PEGA domain-containing protein [Planctomycetota bacterium]
MIPVRRGKLAGAIAILLLAGCVERELHVDSDPPGADVYIDGRLAGKTPLIEPFTFYGTHGLVLRRDGFSPATQVVPVRAPWYQIIPLDLFFEHLWPTTLRDIHETKIVLEPLQEQDAHNLIERAKYWRSEAERKPEAGK